MNNLRGRSRSFRDVRWAAVLLIAIAFAVCFNGSAQTTGALLGTVSDQNGAVVPSASVHVTNTDTGFSTTTLSTSRDLTWFHCCPLGAIRSRWKHTDSNRSYGPMCLCLSPRIFAWM